MSLSSSSVGYRSHDLENYGQNIWPFLVSTFGQFTFQNLILAFYHPELIMGDKSSDSISVIRLYILPLQFDLDTECPDHCGRMKLPKPGSEAL